MIEVITCCISIAAFMVSVFSFCITKRFEAKKQTIEAYIQLQKDLFFLYEYKDGEIEDFVTDRSSQEYKTLGSCLAQIEIFTTGIKENVYDFNTAYRMSHGYLDKALRSKIDYLLDMRSEKTDEDYYQATRWLLNKMDQYTCGN